jgi:M6 family metalloprotease-like protein
MAGLPRSLLRWATAALAAAGTLLGGAAVGVPMSGDLAPCRLPGTGALAFGSDVPAAPTLGTVRVAVVPVQFPDHAATRHDRAALSEGVAELRRFLRAASEGRLAASVTILSDWTTLAQSRVTYTDDLTTDGHWGYVADALAASAPVPPGTDVVLVAAAGVGTGYPGGAAILADAGTGVPAPGGTADLVVTMGLAVAAPGRVMVHEVLHTLGLVDLYASAGDDPFPFTGVFDVMGDVAATSPRPTAWARWRLGWIADEDVRCVTGATAVVRLTEPGRPGAQAALVPLADGTAVVVERRGRRGPDRRGPEGVLVTRVDPGLVSGPIRVVGPHGRPDVLTAGQRVAVGGVGIRVRADGTVRIDRLSR